MTKPRALVLLVCLTMIIALAPRAEATFPGRNGHIVFVGGTPDASVDLFAMTADGAHRVNLTKGCLVTGGCDWCGGCSGRRVSR
jgi:hypothetical protein